MTHPAIRASTGDQGRRTRGARKPSAVATASVTTATTGPTVFDAPSGASRIRSSTIGKIDTAMSMTTVPVTTGVIIRRSRGSHRANIR